MEFDLETVQKGIKHEQRLTGIDIKDSLHVINGKLVISGIDIKRVSSKTCLSR